MVDAGAPTGPTVAVLHGELTHVVFGYVAAQHPIPGVGVLFMTWAHWAFVMFVPVEANDADAEDASTRPSARENTSVWPFIIDFIPASR